MLLSKSPALSHTLRTLNRSNKSPQTITRRAVSTLKENPHIYIHPTPSNPQTCILSLLPTIPPTPSLSLGTSTSPHSTPITPSTFTPNPSFLPFLSGILSKYAHLDPQLQSQAAAFATTSTHFSLSPPSTYRQSTKSARGKDSGAPPSASQGGAGSSGHSGYIHLSDTRLPPDYGRIAYPEDIFGSLEVDATGKFVSGDEGKEPGNWQDSGTYRIVTREGIFGLTDFLRGKLVEALREEERKILAGKSG
ncbi:hypothetical protein EAF04_002668 [Stromatinia cepivora]|nr:hypothetical protein EAF04_002668 [Stromatinia cepivora]